MHMMVGPLRERAITRCATAMTAASGEHDSGGKRRPSLRLAGHGTTDELWPMNVLALWTRGRGDASLIRTLGARMHGREMEGNLEFGTIPRALPPTFGGSMSFPVAPLPPLCFHIFQIRNFIAEYSVPRIDLCYIFFISKVTFKFIRLHLYRV